MTPAEFEQNIFTTKEVLGIRVRRMEISGPGILTTVGRDGRLTLVQEVHDRLLYLAQGSQSVAFSLEGLGVSNVKMVEQGGKSALAMNIMLIDGKQIHGKGVFGKKVDYDAMAILALVDRDIIRQVIDGGLVQGARVAVRGGKWSYPGIVPQATFKPSKPEFYRLTRGGDDEVTIMRDSNQAGSERGADFRIIGISSDLFSNPSSLRH